MTLPYWTLVSDSLPPTGIFKIMMFLDIVLTSGHGILIFTVFILDIEDLFNAIKKLVSAMGGALGIGWGQTAKRVS